MGHLEADIWELCGFTEAEKAVANEVERFIREFGGVPSVVALDEMFGARGRADVLQVVSEIKGAKCYEGADLQNAVMTCWEGYRKSVLEEHLIRSGQILRGEVRHEKQTYEGFDDATKYLLRSMMPLVGSGGGGGWIGGDLRERTEVLRQDYLKQEEQTDVGLVYTGFDEVDGLTHGVRKGELVTIAAFVGELKTTILLNMFLRTAIKQRLNCVYFSLETPPMQLWRIMASVHSCEPAFSHPPLPYDQIKAGRLNPDDRHHYFNKVLPDLRENNDYGMMWVEPPTANMTVSEIRARAEMIAQVEPVDVIFVDYDLLVQPDAGERYGDYVDRCNAVVRRLKELALTFGGGEGAVVINAHQINRKGKEEADKQGGIYTISALAYANEIEKASDMILASYLDHDLRARNEVKISNLKTRDGALAEPFIVFTDLEFRFIGGQVIRSDDVLMETLLDAF